MRTDYSSALPRDARVIQLRGTGLRSLVIPWGVRREAEKRENLLANRGPEPCDTSGVQP